MSLVINNFKARIAKAWVNFNGSGTVAIRGSYNVSSITDDGTGKYKVNFSTAMADTNYSFTSAGAWALSGDSVYSASRMGHTRRLAISTDYIAVGSTGNDNTWYDAELMMAQVFGN